MRESWQIHSPPRLATSIAKGHSLATQTMLDLSLSISREPRLDQPQPQPAVHRLDHHHNVEFDHWTSQQKRNFKRALSEFSTDIPNFFEKIASKVPGKSIEQVQKYFDSCYKLQGNMHVLVHEDEDLLLPSMLPPNSAGRKRACYWTQNEHEHFLMGVAKHGMGMWKQIAEDYVRSKTVVQVLDHAQEFFNGADKKRLCAAIELFDNSSINGGRIIATTIKHDTTTSKGKLLDGDHDDNDDDDVIVLDMDPGIPPPPRRVPQTLNLFPLASLASSSQEEEERKEEEEIEEVKSRSTLNLFPTHPTNI